MKGMFPQYDDTSPLNFNEIWKNATFVFDTNVLLNLYRYRLTTRDELLSVLENLSKQIWIPHHVALEFQRNRRVVIADQNKRFAEVRDAIEKTRKTLITDLEKLQLKKRHSVINPDAFLASFNGAVSSFFSELDLSQENQQQPTGPDPLKQKLETLFNGKVGTAPANQAEIDALYKEGELRYKLDRPPGFKDANKDKDQPDEHFHSGITYKRKYGDLVIWKQMLGHAQNESIKTLVFVSDDGKDDWWSRVGHKTVGPRPELIDEAKHASSIDTFLMYSLENFLGLANKFLKTDVSEETLREIRDVSVTSNRTIYSRRTPSRRSEAVELLGALLRPAYDEIDEYNFLPDILAKRDGRDYGFEVVEVNGKLDRDTMDQIKAGMSSFKGSNVDDCTLVLLARSEEEGDLLAEQMLRIPEKEKFISDVHIMIVAIDDEESETSLIICAEFPY